MGWILWIPMVGMAVVAYALVGVAVQWMVDWYNQEPDPRLECSLVALWPVGLALYGPAVLWRLIEPLRQEVYDILQRIYSPTTDGEGTG